jgi:general secretion pathway protein G
MKRTQSGFTLIELLVVIAIIGLLSTLAVVALNSARQRSRDAKRVSDIRQIQTALELAYSEVNSYPVAATAITLGDAGHKVLCNVPVAGVGTPVFQTSTTVAGTCTTVYMGLVPANPLPKAPGLAAVYDNYSYASTATGYSLTFGLEGATGQLSAGVNCANGNGIQADDATPGC